MQQKYCFCTLAISKRYRTHAKILAKDIQKHAPNISFLVLTDKPADFEEFPHVVAIKHQLQSIKGYHDKRFVIEKAFEKFETCIFVDSDVRILGSVPTEIDWNPGITARTGCNILDFIMDNKTPEELSSKSKKILSIIEQLDLKLDLNLQETKWFHEFMFVVKKQSGAEKSFFESWETISYLFEMQGIYDGVGYSMSLAASKAGFTIEYDRNDWFPFFKDNIERERIKNGQSQMIDKQVYFDEHQAIEYPQYSLLQKMMNKLIKKVVFYYRLLRLRYFVMQHSEFQQLR